LHSIHKFDSKELDIQVLKQSLKPFDESNSKKKSQGLSLRVEIIHCIRLSEITMDIPISKKSIDISIG
jgi:hypothetical protein